MSQKESGGLQIDQDLKFQQKEWLAEEIGRAAMVLTLLAALLGLLGANGPLSSTTRGQEGDPLWVSYNRFAHWTAPDRLSIHISPEALRENQVRLVVNGSFTQSYEIKNIVPQPDRVEGVHNRLIYQFSAQPSTQPLEITYYFDIQRMGVMTSWFQLPGGEPVMVQQLVYP